MEPAMREATIGTPMIAGRDFGEADTPQSVRVTVEA